MGFKRENSTLPGIERIENLFLYQNLKIQAFLYSINQMNKLVLKRNKKTQTRSKLVQELSDLETRGKKPIMASVFQKTKEEVKVDMYNEKAVLDKSINVYEKLIGYIMISLAEYEMEHFKVPIFLIYFLTSHRKKISKATLQP